MQRRLAMIDVDVHELGAESLVTTRRVVGGHRDPRSLCRGTSQQRARRRAKSHNLKDGGRANAGQSRVQRGRRAPCVG